MTELYANSLDRCRKKALTCLFFLRIFRILGVRLIKLVQNKRGTRIYKKNPNLSRLIFFCNYLQKSLVPYAFFFVYSDIRNKEFT